MLDVPEPWWDLNFDSITSYERNLPHWRQDGAVYFVTFRLKDSIPKSVLEAWEHDRRIWLAANGVTDANDPTDRLQRYRAIPIERRRAYERDQARGSSSSLTGATAPAFSAVPTYPRSWRAHCASMTGPGCAAVIL